MTPFIRQKMFVRLQCAVLGAVSMFITLYFSGYLWRGHEGCFVASSAKNTNLPKVTHFSFRPYQGDEELKSFAESHFPVGTERTYIEAILSGHGGAEVTEIKDVPAPSYTTVVYRHRFVGFAGGVWECSTGLSFVFNERNETTYISSAQKWTVRYRPYSIIGGCDGL